MGHAIQYRDYHCSISEKAILKELNSFAYDPQESCGYHNNMTFHKDPVYKNYDEAKVAIERMDRGCYDDHAVRYRNGRKIYWLVKVEWHC